MRLRIDGPNGAIFERSDETAHVLVPLDKNERALAFQALVDALALLTGFTPQTSSDARVTETGQSNSQNPRYSDDHTSGVVVPLIVRRDAQAVQSMRDTDSRDGLDR
jgi:hypothetical protein